MPVPGLPEVTPQLRRSDPLNDRDVKAKVEAGEELTKLEKLIRRVYAQKKPIGGFFVGLGTFLTAAHLLYPEQEWVQAIAVLSGVGGGLLLGGGAQSLKSDQYEQSKNELLKERGLM